MGQKLKAQTVRGTIRQRAPVLSWYLAQAISFALVSASLFAPHVARAGVVINEINYHPDTDEEREEYVELYNTGATLVNLANWRFTEGISYTFPSGTTLAGYGYLVIARDRERVTSLFGISNVVGDFSGQLDNKGGRLTVVDDHGTTVDTVAYDDKWPWPAAADGAGSSLELVNPNDDNDHPRNWRGATATATTNPITRATPGAANSVYSTNTPPFIHEIAHWPASPRPSQPVTVTARMEDSNAIAQATVSYSVSEGTTQTMAMNDDGAHGDGAAGDGVYGAIIPAQPNHSIVAYWISARDGAGATERFPYAVEPEQALAYFVYDGAISTNLPMVWLFLSAADKARLDADPFSDQTVPATFVDDRRHVYYHVQVRYRGGGWARSRPKKCWKIRFNKGNEYDNRGAINLNASWIDETLAREHLAYEVYRMASYPASLTRLLRLQLAAGGPSQFQGVYIEVEQPGGDFLERQGLDRDGALYRAMDSGVSPFRSNESSQPVTLYPAIYEKETRRWEDYSDLIAWTQGLAATPPSGTLDYFRNTTDLWRLSQYLAINALVSNWDHVGKNHYDFRDPGTNLWIQMPWDLDCSLGKRISNDWPPQAIYCTTQPLDYGRQEVPGPVGMYSYLHDRYLEEPRLFAFYCRTLRRLCYLAFTEQRMHAMADRVRALMGNDAQLDYDLWRAGASFDQEWTFWRTTRDYVRERRNYVLSNLPVEGDVVVNEFMASNTRTHHDEAGDYDDWVELYNPKATTVSLAGCYLSDNLSIPTRWRIPAGTIIRAHECLLIWCDGEPDEGPLHASFRLDADGEQIAIFDTDANGNLPIDWWTFGPQVADVSAGRNGDGSWQWTAYSTPTPGRSNPTRTVGVPTVRINEWLASNHQTNTDEKDEYEDWIELYNYGDEPVCIGGCFLTDGINKHDTWMIPYATIIAPGGFVVAWCDEEGDDGPLHTSYRLDVQKGGEIALYDPQTTALIDWVRFGAQQSDVSEGCYPDGAARVRRLDRPTPGRPNFSSNTASWRWRLLD